jgi:hypothetical protein
MQPAEPNPYQSPAVDKKVVSNTTGHRRFRWRFVPAGILLLYGSGVSIGGVAAVCYMLFVMRGAGYAESQRIWRPWSVLCCDSLMIVYGVLLVVWLR